MLVSSGRAHLRASADPSSMSFAAAFSPWSFLIGLPAWL